MNENPAKADFFPGIRREAIEAADSGIVDVFNYGRDREGLIPLWVGEGDRSTPDFICEAAARSLADGETFYTHQRGLPPLRTAIAAYMARTYGKPYKAENFFVTGSGMHALQVAMRLIAGAGDEVIVPTPAWPNFEGAIGVSGAATRCVPMVFGQGGWALDIEALAAAITPKTKALVINSPGNPTGWTASAAELRQILDLARAHGLWIVSDEIYGRFVYDGGYAPSFQEIALEDDRILFVQSMSKNWAMTGWRVGWIQAPAHLGQIIENLIQYSVSGVPVPTQRSAIAALDQGDAFIAEQIGMARQNRDTLCGMLEATDRVRFTKPLGAFYLFFSIDGVTDSRTAAFKLVDEANIGLAPGTAFGPGGEDFFRLCFARRADHIVEAAERLRRWIGSL